VRTRPGDTDGGRGGRRPTLAAIAAEAGVSLPTVSKVVNGRPDVAPATRARVERLLDERRYSRADVRRRRRRRSGLVDLVFNGLDSPWAVEILRGVEEWYSAHQMGVAVSAVRHGNALPASWTSAVASHETDGVILILVTSQLAPGQIDHLRNGGVPLVVVDPVNPPPPDMPSVGATNWAGGLAATEHLLGLGHTRIGVIGGPADYLCSRARIDGYRSALEQAGIRFDPGLVRNGDFRHEGGFARGGELLDLTTPDGPLTAIFAGSDQQALGVYEAARQRGLRIPQDLSVVGFDDLPVARWVPPPLTTVRQPLAEMGRVAAEVLGDLIEGVPPRSSRVELSTELIIRESTAPPERPLSQHGPWRTPQTDQRSGVARILNSMLLTLVRLWTSTRRRCSRRRVLRRLVTRPGAAQPSPRLTPKSASADPDEIDTIPVLLARVGETALPGLVARALAEPEVTVAAVCGGSLALAMAGLLEGRHVVTHE
jgi:LacI family transcriptional regulator